MNFLIIFYKLVIREDLRYHQTSWLSDLLRWWSNWTGWTLELCSCWCCLSDTNFCSWIPSLKTKTNEICHFFFYGIWFQIWYARYDFLWMVFGWSWECSRNYMRDQNGWTRNNLKVMSFEIPRLYVTIVGSE